MNDPTVELPRDKSGSYLHLKLKRFPSLKALTMPFAKRSWTEHPHDVEVDISPSKRSTCRQCHFVIEKGELRARLWLQCHKGCKNSAYFHGKSCLWKYPETIKITGVQEMHGFQKLPTKDQKFLEEHLAELQEASREAAPATSKTTSSKAKVKKAPPTDDTPKSPRRSKRRRTN